MFVAVLLCLISSPTQLGGQTASVLPSPTRTAPEATVQEIEELRRESDRLRKELDNYKKDLDDRNARVSSDLRVVAFQLSKDIKDDFWNSITRFLGVLGLLVAVATTGGFWKLSDIITSRITAKVDEKEKDIQKLRDQVTEALLDFRSQARDALKELEEGRRAVAVQTEAAIADIRGKTVEFTKNFDASGKTKRDWTEAVPVAAGNTGPNPAL